MQCQDIMKKEIECAAPDESAQAAATRMREQGIGFLPVCDPNQRVLGAITDRDIAIRVVADGLEAATPIGDVMTREMVACRADDPLRVAEQLMARHHKSRIMVLDAGGKLAGVISLSDIAQVERGSRAARTLREVSEREAHLQP